MNDPTQGISFLLTQRLYPDEDIQVFSHEDDRRLQQAEANQGTSILQAIRETGYPACGKQDQNRILRLLDEVALIEDPERARKLLAGERKALFLRMKRLWNQNNIQVQRVPGIPPPGPIFSYVRKANPEQSPVITKQNQKGPAFCVDGPYNEPTPPENPEEFPDFYQQRERVREDWYQDGQEIARKGLWVVEYTNNDLAPGMSDIAQGAFRAGGNLMVVHPYGIPMNETYPPPPLKIGDHWIQTGDPNPENPGHRVQALSAAMPTTDPITFTHPLQDCNPLDRTALTENLFHHLADRALICIMREEISHKNKPYISYRFGGLDETIQDFENQRQRPKSAPRITI